MGSIFLNLQLKAFFEQGWMRGEGSIPDSLLKISTGAVESNFRKLDEKSDAQVDSPCSCIHFEI